jgi:acetoin utilization deacetylase AcuC-like enzyme
MVSFYLMKNLLYFYPDGHEAHFEAGHPERPERVEAMRKALQAAGWWEKFPRVAPASIPLAVLAGIHEPSYLNQVTAFSKAGRRFDSDTYLTSSSWDLAVNAAGGGIAVAESVWQGKASRGYALTRPPGHHATANRAMGFCLLNNIAIAAEYLLQSANAGRLAIVDIDLHHGNGTQDIFWSRSDVLFISTHQSPLYPGTGRLEEVGVGDGEGLTVNLPLPPYSGDLALAAALNTVILPLLDRYRPEMVLVSAGFDPHWRDPLGSLLVSGEGYYAAIATLAAWADKQCKGKISLFLEGGYDLEAAGICAQAAVAALLGLVWEDPLGPSPSQEDHLWQKVLKEARKIWDL